MKKTLLSQIADQDNVREWTKPKRKDKQWKANEIREIKGLSFLVFNFLIYMFWSM